MASGFDARIGIARETTYGTRVAPSRFLPLTAEDLGFEYSRYFSPAIGTGMWGRASVLTTAVGSGSISGDVPTTGFGYLLDGLHGNTVTPTQLGGTAAYEQVHSLSTPPSKSYTVQVQTPPVTSATLVPHDMLGVMLSGATFSWSPGGVLSFEMPAIVRELDLSQANAAYSAPAGYSLFSFQGGRVEIGGVLEGNIIGDGSLEIGYSLRDDAFSLGSAGRIAKPVLTDKPSASGSFTADFNDNTNLNRVVDNTIADVVLRFEGATIAGVNKFTFELTIPDCVFTSDRPTVSDPGPVQQTVRFESASSTNRPPVIRYVSTDTLL